MANRRGYRSVASAWWLIGLGIVLLFIPPLFWLGLVLIFGGIILGLAGWFEQEGEERDGIRASGDRASEYLGGITGGWIIALGVVLCIIPTPLTTLIGILVYLLALGYGYRRGGENAESDSRIPVVNPFAVS